MICPRPDQKINADEMKFMNPKGNGASDDFADIIGRLQVIQYDDVFVSARRGKQIQTLMLMKMLGGFCFGLVQSPPQASDSHWKGPLTRAVAGFKTVTCWG